MNVSSIVLAVSSFVITLTGDILLDRGVRQVVEQKGIDQLFSAGMWWVIWSAPPRRSMPLYSSSMFFGQNQNG